MWIKVKIEIRRLSTVSAISTTIILVATLVSATLLLASFSVLATSDHFIQHVFGMALKKNKTK
jgi:hypothetical protein